MLPSLQKTAKPAATSFEVAANPFAADSPWRAYGPDKQQWKEDGNYYTEQELHQMDRDPNVSLQCGIAERVINAD